MFTYNNKRTHTHTHNKIQALSPYHQHVHVLSLRPPTAAHPYPHYVGLRRLVKRLCPPPGGVRTLQVGRFFFIAV